MKRFDDTNPLSIEAYGKKLVGHTFQEVIDWSTEHDINKGTVKEAQGAYSNKSRKGGLGNLLEQLYFGYDINSCSDADFKLAGVELKATPYEIRKDGSKRAGERLVLTMIDYNNPMEKDFYKSHLWEKCRLLLLVYYLRDKTKDSNLMYEIDYVKLFTPTPTDLRIIEQDYKAITDKIMAGKAHELSESDTMYLGACTKGATAAKSTVKQYYNDDILARKRAFCYKNSYMTSVLNDYIINDIDTYEPIIKNKEELENCTFAEYITGKINQYIGCSDEELCRMFDREYNNNKAQWYDLVFRMLGIKSSRALEFKKANIVVKAIRINEKNTMVESSPLPNINFENLVSQDWEDSDLYNYLSATKFFFVVYHKSDNGYILKGCQLWNMPSKDLEQIVFDGWQRIRKVVQDGVVFTPKKQKNGIVFSNNFPKKSDNSIIHIRPHASKRYYVMEDGAVYGNGTIADADKLPDGRWMPKQSFWLNNTYVLSILDEHLKKN